MSGVILVSHLMPQKEECVVTPCLGLERGDFKNTLPIEKKKQKNPPNLMSLVGGWSNLAQPQQKTENNYRQYCKAGQPETQPNSTVWGREGWRLVLKQVGKKKKKKTRGGRGGGEAAV